MFKRHHITTKHDMTMNMNEPKSLNIVIIKQSYESLCQNKETNRSKYCSRL